MINLSILLLIPLVTALLVLICSTAAQIRMVALLGSVAQLGYSSLIMFDYMSQRTAGNKAQMLYETRHSWFSSLNIEYYVGVDGISVAMIMLTAVVVMTGILISWNVTKMARSEEHHV